MKFKLAILSLVITVLLTSQNACLLGSTVKEQLEQYHFEPFPVHVQKDLPDENTVLQELKNRHLVSESATIKKTLKPDSGLPAFSANAGYVMFIKNANETVVAKVFKDIGGYHGELKGYNNSIPHQETVNEFRQNSNIAIPIIIQLKKAVVFRNPNGGDDIGVFLLEKARGKSLDDYIKHINGMTDDEIKTVFSNTGEQFGSLDSLMFAKGNTTLQHSDSFGSNIFYDGKTNQVYWIDIAGKGGLASIRKANGLEDLIFLNNLYIKTCNEIEFNEGKGALKLIKAIHYFVQGYYNKNKIESAKKYHNNFKCLNNSHLNDYIKKNNLDWNIK